MTYGSATLDKKKARWRLEVEPHVAIRLKRVFGSLARGRTGPLSLPHNAETCRDLQWFCDRYPLDIQPREALEAEAEKQRERERMVADILSGRLQPKAFDLAVPAREYQKVAATMALEMGSLLLADDVGTGKTASAICALTDPRTLPALVVTLTHLPRQWEAEVRRFAPNLRTHILKKGTPYPLSKSEQQGQGALISDAPDVIIANYHKLAGWHEALAGQVRTVIFDEVQELRRRGDRRNPSKKYQAAKAIADAATFKLGLSATPIYNYGGEILNVMEVLKPGSLGTRGEFYGEWCTGYQGDDKARIKDPRAFGTFMRDAGFMLRRTRADVGRELPELTRVVHEIDADLAALERIQSSAADLARLILQTNPAAKGEKWRAAEELSWMVRQATGVAKCLAPGTKILMADGSTECVENLRVGDRLLGPDSKPRRILATTSGFGPMFEIRSTSRTPLFDPYTVNSDHVLALKHTGPVRPSDRGLFAPYLRGDHVEISVGEYLSKSKHFKRLLKGYKTGVEFPKANLPVDPYFLGLWLGDGSSDSVAITTPDPEIREYLFEVAASFGVSVRVTQGDRTAPTFHLAPPIRGGDMRSGKHRKRNLLLSALQDLGVLRRKHVPSLYLRCCRTQRMQLLAGLLDSDGHLDGPGGYTIATRWRHLAEEIQYLAQSLGCASKLRSITAKTQHGKYFPAFRVSICGNGLHELPMRVGRKRSPARQQIKDPLRSGIDVVPVGDGPFHGFALEGDGLFLLHDFTVTHNSPFVADFVRLLVESGERVVLFGWHRDVYDLWLDRLKDLSPALYSGSESPNQKDEAKRRFVDGETPVLIMSLRSGAGLDGLQGSCRTVVFGELDWSPAVHTQAIGRVHRDGQGDPVVAYFLVAESGSDPIVREALGLKQAQSDGIVDPHGGLIEQIADGDHVRRLAESYVQASELPAVAAAG